MARYAPKQWKAVAILMRESSYNIIAALHSGPKSWTELKRAAGLTDAGLQAALRQLIEQKVVEQILVNREHGRGLKDKRYSLSEKAKKNQVYEKMLSLKEALQNL